jgi:hypothetical protein
MTGLVIALCLALLSVASADPGSGQLTGRAMLDAGGCGRDRATFAIQLVVAADGTWTALDADGTSFAGTSAPKGRSGRKHDLAFDPDTEQGFVSVLAADVAELCEVPEVTVDTVKKKALTLTVNRKGTRAAIVLRYVLRGTAAGRRGTATYRMNAKGSWTPAAAPAAGGDRGAR